MSAFGTKRRRQIPAVIGLLEAIVGSRDVIRSPRRRVMLEHLKGDNRMPAYLIAEHKVTEPTKFEEYRVKVGPMIAKHGGRYLTKGGSHKLPEGGHWKPERVVIIEFPDIESLNAWYNSPEYQPLITLRKQCTSDLDMLITLEGA
jgi:uncharacterized protein (DUF1330 family)